ncbi:putative transmembrane protein, partial [Toxoplasma gondii VEG]
TKKTLHGVPSLYSRPRGSVGGSRETWPRRSKLLHTRVERVRKQLGRFLLSYRFARCGTVLVFFARLFLFWLFVLMEGHVLFVFLRSEAQLFSPRALRETDNGRCLPLLFSVVLVFSAAWFE